MSIIRLIALIVVAGSMLVVAPVSGDVSGTFSGRVWHDINRNGLQDEGEPGMSNLVISIVKILFISGGFAELPLEEFYTDADGHYNFSFSTNHSFHVIFAYPPFNYGISPLDVGDNDMIDADFGGSYYVTNEIVNYENKDLGLYCWNPGLSFDVQLNQYPPGQSLYITSGAPVTITYRVTNTGETWLSEASIYDVYLDDNVDYLHCPEMLAPGEFWAITTQRVIYASMTSMVEVVALSVSPYCRVFEYPLSIGIVDPVIIVDSWADELKIQSLNTDGELAFTEIEHATGYQVQWKTNFMDDVWSAQSPPDVAEIPSLGPGLRVATLDLDISASLFRLAAVTNQ